MFNHQNQTGMIMSAEELKIRGELEKDVERDLEEEIKDGIYRLALRLRRLYQHQKERNSRESSEFNTNGHHQQGNKILSEVNICIRMDGGTKIEKKEIKKGTPLQGRRPQTARSESTGRRRGSSSQRFDWAKSLRK